MVVRLSGSQCVGTLNLVPVLAMHRMERCDEWEDAFALNEPCR